MRAYRQFALVYDRLMEDMPYAEWLRFARQCWELAGIPETVVDLGCGTGNIAIPLAKSGFRVFGIDLSADMLAVARSKWDASPHRYTGNGSIRWLQQDMRDWELPEQVDAVLSFCDCINYLLEEEDVEATFRATRRGLKDGGLFLFDVHAPRQLERYAREQPFTFNERDIAYIWTSEYSPDRREIEHHLTIFTRDDRDGKYIRFEETHIQRAYEPEWIRGALLRAGFSHVEMYADFKFEAPGEDAERLFFAATA